MKHSTLAGLVALFALTGASRSFAWDSATRDGVRDMPIVRTPGTIAQSNWQAGQTSFSAGPGPWLAPLPDAPDSDNTSVYVTNLKDRIGGLSSAPGDATTSNAIYSCTVGFMTLGDGSTLTGCVPAKVDSDLNVDDLGGPQRSWLVARKAADDAQQSEHYLIAQMAANLAGLSNLAIFHPFWVRYPTRNAYLASPTQNPQTKENRALVAQSLQPAASLLSSTQALRSVSLLELAQLPDFSNSLADWAAGNELCPLSGIEGAFSTSTELVQVCHEWLLMGSINATHFAPLNRESWRYYHSLAIQRMAGCPKLGKLQQPFYADYDPVVCAPGTSVNQCDATRNHWYQVMHGNATEMHECEREAMAYEMFAQHFMQDSWATGHMWKRWGKANFSEFDSTFPEYSGASGIPQENLAPRRAAIALMTGVLAGEIHGAKSKIIDFLRENYPVAEPALLWLGLGDDPLSGPNYQFRIDPDSEIPSLTQDVEWRSQGGARFPGAGDLFWNPDPSTQVGIAVVSQQSKYAEQRSRMLECSAASMLEAYNAHPPPHAFGEPIPDPSLAVVLPDTDACWEHWATNQAMRAALGSLNVLYDPRSQLNMANTVNAMVLNKKKNDFGFVSDKPADASLPHYAARRADRDAFIAQLGQRMNKDMGRMSFNYVTNEDADWFGDQSAHGIAHDGSPITVFGVGPIDTPPAAPPGTNAPPPSPPTDYSDRLSPQDASDYAPSDAGSLGNAMAQMFWRGNVERTCRTSLMNNAQELLLLQAKCMAKAAGGGNPDACTACVEVAELHIPNLSHGSDPHVPVGDSKCSALGVTETGQVPAGLPAWWFDNFYRLYGQTEDEQSLYPAGALDHPAYHVALSWCTGAEQRASKSGSLQSSVGYSDVTSKASDDAWLPARDSEISFEKTGEGTCYNTAGDAVKTVEYGTSHRRYAQAYIESYNPTDENWVFPLATAVDYTVSILPVGDCDASFTDSRTQRFLTASGSIPQSKISRSSGGASGISAPRCGVQQRLSYWNRPCSIALQGWASAVPAQFDTFFPKDGSEVDHVEYGQDGNADNDYCLVREPRNMVSACPQGMTCSADGECSFDDVAATVIQFPPPPPPPSP